MLSGHVGEFCAAQGGRCKWEGFQCQTESLGGMLKVMGRR